MGKLPSQDLVIPTQTLALSASWVCIWVARGPYLSPSICAPGMMISPTSAPVAELRAGLTVQLAASAREEKERARRLGRRLDSKYMVKV